MNIRGMYLRLVRADAVLAGDRAAVLDAQVEDRARHLLGPLGLARHGVVEEHQRVQVAVAGVEDVGHPDAVLAADSSAMRRSTSGSAVRGITPSWTM